MTIMKREKCPVLRVSWLQIEPPLVFVGGFFINRYQSGYLFGGS